MSSFRPRISCLRRPNSKSPTKQCSLRPLRRLVKDRLFITISPWTCPQCHRLAYSSPSRLMSGSTSSSDSKSSMTFFAVPHRSISTQAIPPPSSRPLRPEPFSLLPSHAQPWRLHALTSSTHDVTRYRPSIYTRNPSVRRPDTGRRWLSTESPRQQDLPSAQDGRRSHTAKRVSHMMDHLQDNLFIAGQRLNDLTGYSGIEALKRSIDRQEDEVQTTRAALRAAKDAFNDAIAQRSASQREVNELLQRKHGWTPADLERFTTLYRSDHTNEQAEVTARERLTEAERAAEESSAVLSRSILARYHEEQIWSDKIRRMSTWGTWGLMGLNVLLFLVVQIAIEPWRRRRLVHRFEEKVREALAAGDTTMATAATAAKDSLESGCESETAFMDSYPSFRQTVGQPAAPPLPEGDLDVGKEMALGFDLAKSNLPPWAKRWLSPIQTRMEALLSPRPVLVRQVDLTTMALEGVAIGAAGFSILAALIFAR